MIEESDVCDEVGERLEVVGNVDVLEAPLVLERDTGRLAGGMVDERCEEKSKAGGR